VLSFSLYGANTLPASTSEPLRPTTSSKADIQALADALVTSLEDDKAEDLVRIDLSGKSSLADTMILASGRSARHVGALADHLAKKVKELTGRPASIEGMPNADWVLLDLGDVIVHLFRPEVRSFYNLEKIWASDDAGHLGKN